MHSIFMHYNMISALKVAGTLRYFKYCQKRESERERERERARERKREREQRQIHSDKAAAVATCIQVFDHLFLCSYISGGSS